MLFLETWFWLFAAAAVPVYWLCPRPLKLYWLLVASAVFQYHFAGSAGMAPIIVLALLTYLAALVSWPVRRPSFATIVVVVLVGALAFYKYSEFLLRSASGLVVTPPPAWVTAWKSPAIPLGISFFTFE